MTTDAEMIPPRSVPVTDDIDTGGFFEAAARRELVVRACTACDAVLHAPIAYCGGCGSWDTAWRRVAGAGTVYSWTVVEHRTHAAFPVPFTLVLVALDDAPVRLVGHLPGRPELRAGQAMRVRFDERPDGTVVPDWEPAL
jgi:uncharacterized protein